MSAVSEFFSFELCQISTNDNAATHIENTRNITHLTSASHRQDKNFQPKHPNKDTDACVDTEADPWVKTLVSPVFFHIEELKLLMKSQYVESVSKTNLSTSSSVAKCIINIVRCSNPIGCNAGFSLSLLEITVS